ncbi:uncharacterized protein [Zea mays]|jgi:hypothetical protein|uniref:Putative RING zinc finger domain superfamily protein n=1 Tax=Zea mays TaxID=4577 RepID=K7V652_MAIZE|nr:uncharacterized protein LOC103636359 [Zea mays]AQK98698.1 Putative RING zinc finger domain superfamily protein [Zea mays]|eukprot:XP_008656941.1 uncharacterized protein LOC103636359 [Zea mays]
MDGRRPEMRRTMTLSEQLSTPDPLIRDFLKIPHDADAGEGDSPSAVDAQGGGRTTGWKQLRDRLRLRRAAGAWQRRKTGAAAAHAPANGGGLSNISSANNRSNKYNYNPGEAEAAFSRTFSRAPSLRATPTFSRVASTRVGPASCRSSSRRLSTYDFRDVEERRHEDEDEDGDGEEEEDGEDEGDEEKTAAPAAQMSLMALLGQTDNQWDDDEDEEEESGGGAFKKGGAGAVGDEDEDDCDSREDEMVHVCCVCMVRHKGAAFIPCGHTFCRLCSRELWVSRGNCPLCNGFIQEILDIF